MPYKMNWYIKEQIVSATIWGDRTAEELVASNQDMIKKLEESDRPKVHAIINDENLISLPVNLLEFRKILTFSEHPKLGWVVMVGNVKNSATNILIVMLMKIINARYIRFRTFDEALAHLQKVDPTIDWDAVSNEEKGTN